MKIIAFGDIHILFDRDEKARYMQELSYMKEYLLNNNCDILIFAGDTLHKAYTMDDDIVPIAFGFIADIMKICEYKNIVFRIIKGTSSHDAKFVETLDKIYGDVPFFRAIYNYEIEDIKLLDKTYSFRWLPETYGDGEEYENMIKNVFNCITDFTFFHGSMKSIAVDRFKDAEYKPTTLPKAFIWEDDRFISHNKYFAAGGHIHEPITISNKIFYLNNFTTHNFSDKTEKGWMEFEIDPNSDNFTWKRCVNPLAPKYSTVIIENIHKINYYEFEEKLKQILLSLNAEDHIRFIVKGIAHENNAKNMSILNSLSKMYKIKILSQIQYNDTIVEDNNTEFNMFTDDNTPISEKVKNIYDSLYGDINIKEIEDILR